VTILAHDTGGFVTEDEEQVHSWAMFGLVRRDVVAPDGERFSRSHVRSPGAVAVVAITHTDEVVLVSQFRAALGRMVVEIPAGMRDIVGEDPLDTARRELMEETGCTAERWSLLGTIHSAPGITDSEVIVYLAQDVQDGAASPHGPEERHMNVRTVPVDEAIRDVLHGRITDAKSAFGLLAAERIVRRAS
jgi:ADP-ribose pyrophosphatase